MARLTAPLTDQEIPDSLARDAEVSAVDTAVLHKATDETITGIKDFQEPFRVSRLTEAALVAKTASQGALVTATNKLRGLWMKGEHQWFRLVTQRVDVKEFGAIGDGTSHPLSERFGSLGEAQATYPHAVALTDEIDWAAIVAANSAFTGRRGGIVVFPDGTYRTTYKIVQPVGVCWEGERCNAFNGGFVQLSWFGAAGVDSIVEVSANVGGTVLGQQYIKRINVKIGKDHTLRPLNGITYKGRVDFGTFLEEVAVTGVDAYGVDYQGGGHNIHNREIRFDGCKEAAIRWVVTGTDSLKVDGWTVDNVRADLATGGGALLVEANPAPSTDTRFFLRLEDGKFEINTPLATGKAAIILKLDPAASPRNIFNGEFDTVWMLTAGANPVKTGVLLDPPNDYVRLVLRNCKLLVEGIPSYVASLVGNEQYHVNTVIAPFGPSRLGGSGAWVGHRSVSEVIGDQNVIGDLYSRGTRLSAVYLVAAGDSSWDSKPTTVYPGTVFEDSATGTQQRVVAVGTVGTLSSVTGSGASGQTSLTVNNASKIVADHRIVVNGNTYIVTEVNYSTNVVVLSSSLLATASAATVEFAAPTLESSVSRFLLATKDELRWSKPTAAIRSTVSRDQRLDNIAALVSGRLSCYGIWLEGGDVISSITFFALTTPAGTPTNQWAVLLSSSRVKLAISTDRTTDAWPSNGAQTFTLTGPYTVPASGRYYLGLNVVAATVPTLYGVSGGGATILQRPPIRAGSADTGLTDPASCPTTVAPLTTLTHIVYAEVN